VFTSTVTVVPDAIVAESPEPGTPAPPHVEALDQLPVVLDVYAAIYRPILVENQLLGGGTAPGGCQYSWTRLWIADSSFR
jgi:hypothetical protein